MRRCVPHADRDTQVVYQTRLFLEAPLVRPDVALYGRRHRCCRWTLPRARIDPPGHNASGFLQPQLLLTARRVRSWSERWLGPNSVFAGALRHSASTHLCAPPRKPRQKQRQNRGNRGCFKPALTQHQQDLKGLLLEPDPYPIFS